MLNLRKLVKNYDDSARSFSELVPWMALIAPGIVLNKDGSLLACFEYDGVDAEGLEQYNIDRHATLAEHGLRLFDERFTVYGTLVRRRTFMYPEGNFQNEVSAVLDQLWKQHFRDSGQFVNTHYLCVLYTPPGGIEGIFEKLAHFTKVEGLSVGKAIAETIRSSLFKRAAFNYEAAQLEAYLSEFENKLDAFQEVISDLAPRMLKDDDLLGFLHRRASPTATASRIKLPEIPVYLDSYLTSSTLVSRGDTLLFRGVTDTYVAAISIKDWPNSTEPGIIDDLMAIPGEIDISQVMRISSTDASRAFLQDKERHNRNMEKSIKSYVVEGITKEESKQVDVGRREMAHDANDALTEISTEGRAYGHYNLTVLVRGSTELECDALAKQVMRLLSHRQFVALRENMHLLSCFAGSMPGQAGALVRWHFVSTANLCDMFHLRSLAIGAPINKHFTDQFSSPAFPIPSLTALPTEFATPYYFNFHQGDLAHTLVVGPSGAGKSTFCNFLIAQHQKYAPCHTFIFDKDYSCRIPTLLQGGAHVDLAGERGGSVKCNPMLQIGDKTNWTWLAGFIELLISSRGYEIKSADSREIWQAISRIAEMSREQWRLVTLGAILPSHLHEHLEQWIGNGQKARYFDNVEDTFDLGSFTCIEMGKLFQDKSVAKAFVEYAFQRISQKLDGRPAIIYIEEAWFMLADDQFASKVDDWLRTLRKKLAWVVMATQSLDEIGRSEIFATIIDNVPNKIFLPNPNAYAHFDMYKDKFGLNEAQISRIATAMNKVHYYVVTPVMSRMVEVRLTPEILAIVRSDIKAQKIFDRHVNSGTERWEFDYMEEVCYGHA